MSAVPPPSVQPNTHLRTLFAGLLLAMLLAALDSTIVATALPTIVAELGGLDRLFWVVTAYLLAQTVVIPLYGKLGDLYGRKRVLQTAGLAELSARQLVRPGAVARSFALTASGCDAYDRLASARRERLAQLAAQWPDAQRQQLAAVLRRLAVDLVPARGQREAPQSAAS